MATKKSKAAVMTRYRISLNGGTVLACGVVQGAGGPMVGVPGLERLRRMASPQRSIEVTVYPEWTAQASGPAVVVNLSGATVDIESGER